MLNCAPMNKADLEILINSLPPQKDGRPTVPPEFAVRLLEDTCATTNLDWKRRHVYLMQRGGKWGVTLSIDGFRLIGAQDGDYAGQDGPYWVTSSEGTWTDIPPDGPIYAAKVGIKHRNGTTTWGVAKFKDYKAGPMWDKFPSTMVAKCAEMLAWRKAFPGRLGGLYGMEEMAQADKGAREVLEQTNTEPTNYDALLKKAMTFAELKRVGDMITSDTALDVDEVSRLHAIYTEIKNSL